MTVRYANAYGKACGLHYTGVDFVAFQSISLHTERLIEHASRAFRYLAASVMILQEHAVAVLAGRSRDEDR